MDRDEFWTTDDDEAVLAEYLAQHSFNVSFSGEDMLVQFGDPDRLPEPGGPERLEANCAVCGSALVLVAQVGWKHLLGLAERDGCTTPWPGEAA